MWWYSLVVWVATTILGELLRPKPKFDTPQPSSIGDFTLPTAQEGRAIPVVWGTCHIRAPNVIWYGGLVAMPNAETVKTGFFSKQTVIRGYFYHLTIHCALCHGPLGESGADGVLSAENFTILYDDRIPAQSFRPEFGGGNYPNPDVQSFGQIIPVGVTGDTRPEKYNIFIDDFYMLGGNDKEGGIVGSVDVYPGGMWNAANDWLQTFLGAAIPAYRGMAYVVHRTNYLGTSPYIKPLTFIVKRCVSPKLYIDGETEADPLATIGEDANPAYIILEIVTDTVWGLGIPPALIDLDSFYDVAATLKAEEFGMSYMLDAPTEASGVIDDVLRHIDGVMYTDPASGLLTLKLARQDYELADLPVFDKSNLASCEMSRGSWSETKNVAKIIYIEGALSESFTDTILLVHFNGTEGQTTAVDEVGNGTVTFNGNAHVDADHQMLGGQSAYFDGSGDSIGISPSGVLGTFWGPGDIFTCELMFENDGAMPEVNGNLIGFITNTDVYGLACYMCRDNHPTAPNTIVLEWKTSPGVGASINAPYFVDGEEHWVRFSHDGTTMRLSVDGVEGASLAAPMSDSIITGIMLGKNPIAAQNNGFFKGWMKEPRITGGRARDASYELPTVQFSYPEHVITGRGNFEERAVQQQNLANIQSRSGELAQEVIRFLGISNAFNANKVAARVLKTLSYPLASFKLTANRDAWALRPGSVLKLNWEPLGVEDMACRVTRIGYGELAKGRIEIDAVEDIFGLADTAFTPPPTTEWVDEVADPEPALAEMLLEMPYHFIATDDRYVAALAVRDSLLDLGYDIWSDRDGDTDPEFLLTASRQPFVPSGLLVDDYAMCTDALDATGFELASGVDLSRLESITATQRDAGVNIALITSINGAEFIAWQTVTGNEDNVEGAFTNIVRGILDTVPIAHPAGSRVWFFTSGFGVVSDDSYPDDRMISAKLLPFNGRGTLAIGDAEQLDITLASRAARPYPPGNVKVNGNPCPSEFFEEDVVLTWSHRHRVLQTTDDVIVHQDEGDYTGTPEGDYIVEIYVGDTLHHTFEDFALSSDGYQVEYTFAQREIDDSNMAAPVTFVITPVNDDDLTGTAREIEFLMSFTIEEDDDMTFEARLTLQTGVPVSSADQTGKTTIYLTPYKGNRIRLYNGSSWATHALAEISIAVPATTATMYDLFVYDNTGTLTLEAVAWTNDTTRATALAVQDGVYVKTGETGKRYAGSFRTTGVSGQTEDSKAKRFLWNYYNRVRKMMEVKEGTNSWTYSTATVRQVNGAAGNQLDFIIGVAEDTVVARALNQFQSSTATNRQCQAGMGLNSTTAFSGFVPYGTGNSTELSNLPSYLTYMPAIGRQFIAWLENGAGTDTQTWYGDNGGAILQSGISGEIMG